MPVEIVFRDSEIREICERRAVAEALIGALAARKLRARLADIRASRSIMEVCVGQPSFLQNGNHAVITFHSPYHLVLEPGIQPIPKKDGRVEWLKIDRARVIYVGKKR